MRCSWSGLWHRYSEDDLEAIFDEFRQVDGTSTGLSEGQQGWRWVTGWPTSVVSKVWSRNLGKEASSHCEFGGARRCHQL